MEGVWTPLNIHRLLTNAPTWFVHLRGRGNLDIWIQPDEVHCVCDAAGDICLQRLKKKTTDSAALIRCVCGSVNNNNALIFATS